jgi:alpha-D-ribose 1-methylphosphonate 5-triphosphate synthase subunit PhnG
MDSVEMRDEVLVECELSALVALVEDLEQRYEFSIARQPGICLTMVQAQDSIELQQFYLGEAITTECEVIHNQAIGYGLCLGEQPQRAYCIAVVDALEMAYQHLPPDVVAFVDHHRSLLTQQQEEEHGALMKSRVDFKLFDEE